MGYYQRVGDDVIPSEIMTTDVSCDGADTVEEERMNGFCDAINVCTKCIVAIHENMKLSLREIELESRLRKLEARAV